jgi:integrase
MRKPFYWKERKVWCVRIKVDGKLTLVRLGETRKAAYDRWRGMIKEIEGGKLIDHRVSDLIDRYLVEQLGLAERGEIAQLTADFRVGYLTSFQAFVGEEMNARELKPHHVHEWLEANSERWGMTSRADAGESVKRAVKWSHDRGYLDQNPVASLKFSRGEGRNFVIDEECYQTLIHGWKQYRKASYAFRAILIALRHTGCRPGEVIKLSIADVASDFSTWTIAEHKTKKKTKRPRVIYLSPCMQTLTRAMIAGRKSGAVFQNASGRWKYAEIRRTFHRLRERAKVDPECVLYSFRHTWITQALVAGVDIATVAEMAGTSIQMIDRHYGHLSRHKEHMQNSALQVAKSWRING